MLNQLQIIGNVGKDPEIRTTQSGSKVASFSVAVTEKWKDKAGAQKEKTQWIPIVIWNEWLVRVVESYVTKGMKVFIQGKWETRKWTDQSGSDRYSTECVLQGFDAKLIMLSSSGEKTTKHTTSPMAEAVDLDDDIPF
jgi:single-strand DNA-binding protein